MSSKEILNLDANYEHPFSQVPSHPLILSSGRKMSPGISLAHYYLTLGEILEYSLAQFAIAINLGESFGIERILNSRLQTGLMLTGAVGLCPMSHP
ncbi:MAG: hypothetical protein MET45_03690 [Nostoc sp. LLA-1]|nr:hypothetical protein [Cyanocohniella sp. LLY]